MFLCAKLNFWLSPLMQKLIFVNLYSFERDSLMILV